MIVPIYIPYRELEEVCDGDGEYAICRSYEGEIEVSVDEIEFERSDLEDIVDQYFDDIIDILLKNKRYTDILRKKMGGENT